jgi:microcystin degradation protein MlrC
MARTLSGEVRPTQAAAMPPIAINIERQQTAASPCRELLASADQMLQQPGVLSNSVVLGFPYADVAEFGSAFIVVTDNNPARAQQLADQLAGYLWQQRQDFVAELIGIDQALAMAAEHPGTSCLLDMGDNIGGGSAADGTLIAHALYRHGGGLRSFVSLYDPAAVRQAVAAGVGAKIKLTMGGHTDDLHGPPLPAEVTLVSLHDGRFHEPSPRHGGRSDYDMGQTAIVETAHGMTLQLTSLRIPPFSLGQLTSCGLDPGAFDVLVAKGVVAPMAAYAPVSAQFIRVNTPGSTTADMQTLPYRQRRRPLFPFEQ